MPKLKKWVEEQCEGRVLNMFGGVVRLLGDVVHNDIDASKLKDGDLNKNAYLLEQWQDQIGSFDTVILDPPYTAFQAVHSYGLKKQQDISHARDVTEWVLKPGGKVITLGFNSTGMSKSRGFTKERIALVNCGASHNDILVVSERRVQ